MEKKIAYLLKSYGFDSTACDGEGAEVQYFTLFYTDFSTLDVSDYLAVALMKFGNVPVTIHHSAKLLSEGIILTNETRSKIDEYRTHYSSKKVIPTEDCLKYLWNLKFFHMNNPPVYWRMRNGTLINVDNMDNNHVRNSFKMLLRNLQKLAEQKNSKPAIKFTLNGDMAQEFHESFLSDKDDDRFDEEHFPMH